MKIFPKIIRLLFLLILAATVITACTSKTSETGETEAIADTIASDIAPKLTDPEIASIAVTANQLDIDYANIALQKSNNTEVKQFATTMAKDHQAVIDQAVALATKLGVTPLDNPTTQSLVSGANDVKNTLNSMSGADFDKAYVDNEVEYHKAAISLVESRLIPESTNEELKALLQSALPLFNAHLEHALGMQNKLSH